MSPEDGNTPEQMSPERFSQNTINGLRTLKQWLTVLEQSGTQIGEEFALPTDKSSKTTLNSLEVKIDHLLEGSFLSTENLMTKDEEEEIKDEQRVGAVSVEKSRALLEQAPNIGKPLWEAVLKLPRKPLTEGVFRKPVENTYVVQLNIEGPENDRSAVLSMSYRGQKEKEVEPCYLMLNLTQQAGGENPVIVSGPLENMAAITLEKGENGAWVYACYQTEQHEKITKPRVRPRTNNPFDMRDLITHEQAETLLPLLSPPQKS